MATPERASITDSPNVSKEEKRRLKKEKKRKRREASTSSCSERTFRGSDVDPIDAPAWVKGLEVQDLSLQVALLPRSLGSYKSVSSQVSKSIREGLLFKYHQATRGVTIAFRKIELVREGKGWIRYELPHTHFTAEIQALVFCPKVGMELLGIVNESFPSHVGVLAFSFFNASVTADQLHRSGYSHDLHTSKWFKPSGDESATFGIGSLVSFKIERMHEVSGEVAINGEQLVCIKS